MKITAVYNPKSGGSYHRVKLWTEFVKDVTLVEDLTEDHVKECDILYIHWNSKIPITQLSIWREKYQFKIIADIDDVWILPQELEYSVFLSQHLCQLADHVICSIEYISHGISEFNRDITVIPNLLPAGYGQFTLGEKKHKKIRVGIGGSISHYHDYLSLRHKIKDFEKDPWFKKNCEWAIIGYNPKDKRWQEIAKMFSNVKLFNVKPHESYMSLYDNLDFMIIPYRETEINRGRSGLKLYECFCKNVIPITNGTMYHRKVVNPSKVFVSYAIDINTIKQFDRPKIVFDQLNYMSTYVDYQKECVDARLKVFSKVIAEPKQEDYHDLYSITYSKDQDVEYKRINNRISTVEEKSYLFEYNKIVEYVECWETYGAESYVGFFSHKFPHKTGFYRKCVENILDKSTEDVVIFCKQRDDYLEWTELQHPGFMKIFEKICKKLDLKIPDGIDMPTVYSNFFAAKADVYREYVDLIKKAIDIMETDLEIKDLCWNDSSYKTGLNPEDLKKYTGLNYYPFHTFILERLMSVWIVNKKLSYDDCK